MSNCSFVDHTRISPNSMLRSSKIDTITIHHSGCIATVESIGVGFLPRSRRASSNYGVGSDGRIGQYVDESRRAMTSDNWKNDNRAITIEVCNDSRGPEWHVSDDAIEGTIKLCVDICQRNGIKSLRFTGDATGNVTLHKWFANTACPGPYLESKIPYIVNQVNKRLSDSKPKKSVIKAIELKNRNRRSKDGPIPVCKD